ncbi:MAG: O-antigen ligase family protein [Myxococcales bacterium]
MSASARLARGAIAWAAALAAGTLATRWNASGAALGVIAAGWTLARGRVPLTVALAGLGAVATAAALPWFALKGDPFHALPATSAWPVAAVAITALGVGAFCWSVLLAAPAACGPPVAASPRFRRALLLELGALALLLPVTIAGAQFALALLAATLAGAWLRGARPVAPTPLDGPVAALFAAAVLSILFAGRPAPLWTTTALRALVAFFVLTRALRLAQPTERELLRVIGLWAAASAAVSVLAFWQHWSAFDVVAALHLRHAIRVPAPESPGHVAGIGTFASRLTFAHVTLLPLAILLGLQIAGAIRRPLPWLAAMAFELAGLWATFARAAWLAVAALAVAVGFLSLATRERARLLAGLAAALSAAALVFAASPGARARGRSGVDPAANRDRLFLWARAAEIAADHPLRGVGLGSYHLILGPYYDRFDPHFPMRTWAHDMPLSLLCETGPLGLFAYCWLLIEGLALANTWRRRSGRGTLAGLALGGSLATLAFAVVAAFHDALYDGLVAYNLFFALALATWTGGVEATAAVL